MRIQNIVTLGLTGTAIARSVPQSLRARDVMSAGSTADLPAIQKSLDTLTKGISDVTNVLSKAGDASTSAATWSTAGKTFNNVLITAGENLRGTPALGIFQVTGLLQPLGKFINDIQAPLAAQGPAFSATTKSPEGKQNLVRFITELEPGLKAYLVSVITQVPPQLTNALGPNVPKKPADLDKPFESLNRGLDVWVQGGFDRYLNSLTETQNAGAALLNDGTLDKILGQAPGSLAKQGAEAAAKAAQRAKDRQNRPAAPAAGGLNLGALLGGGGGLFG